jgi:hypothetical protein
VADQRSDGVVKKKKTPLKSAGEISNTVSKENNTEEVFAESPSYFSSTKR